MLCRCGADRVPICRCLDDLRQRALTHTRDWDRSVKCVVSMRSRSCSHRHMHRRFVTTHNPWHTQSLSIAGAAVGQTLCNHTLQHTHCYITGGRVETVSILRYVAFTHAHSHTLSLSVAAYRTIINTLLYIHTFRYIGGKGRYSSDPQTIWFTYTHTQSLSLSTRRGRWANCLHISGSADDSRAGRSCYFGSWRHVPRGRWRCVYVYVRVWSCVHVFVCRVVGGWAGQFVETHPLWTLSGVCMCMFTCDRVCMCI